MGRARDCAAYAHVDAQRCGDDGKFTKLVVPTADGFSGSHETHMFAGTCKDAGRATTDGPLEVRGVPCACPPCTQLRFEECEMSALHHCKVKRVKAPRAAGETAALKQIESLEAWAASLKSKQLVAVRVRGCSHSDSRYTTPPLSYGRTAPPTLSGASRQA